MVYLTLLAYGYNKKKQKENTIGKDDPSTTLNKTRSPKKVDSDDNASSLGFPVVHYSDSDDDRKEKRKRARSENISGEC